MNINEALKHADDNGKFWKINPGDVCEGYFVGDITPKVLETKDGNKNIVYSINFVKDGIKKEMSVSTALLRQLYEMAEMNKVNFTDAYFVIKRKGAGLETKWLITARPKSQNPVTQLKETFGGTEMPQDEEPQDGVPF